MLLAGGLFSAAVHYPKTYRELHAYQHAKQCPVLGQQRADCVGDLDAVITHVEISSFKGGKHVDEVTVTGPAGFVGGITFADGPSRLFLKPGDHVVVKVWQGRRVLVAAGGREQATSETPVGVPLGWLSIGVAVSLLGLLALDFASRYLSGRLHSRWNESGNSISAVGMAFGVAALLALLSAILPRPSQDPGPGPFLLTWALCMTAVGGVALAIRRYRR